MNEAAQLLQTALGLLLVPVLLGVRALRKKFAEDPDKPTINEAIIYGIMLVLGMALAYGQHTVVSGIAAVSVVDLWWVQGILFFMALAVSDIGVDATSTKTASSQAKIAAAANISGTGIMFALLAMVLFAQPASAQTARLNYPMLDWHRVNFGVSLGARAYGDSAAVSLGGADHPMRYDLEPGAQFSYSANKVIALVAGVTYGTGAKVGSTSEGISYAIATDGMGGGLQLMMRVRAVQYFGDNMGLVIREKQSFDVGLPMSWRILRSKSGVLAGYIDVIPVIDLRNPQRNSIVGCFQVGITPQPPR